MRDIAERWWIEVWISWSWKWNWRWDYCVKIERDSRNWEIEEKVISENMIYEYKNEKFCLWIRIYYKEIEVDWEEFCVVNIASIFLNQEWKNCE